MISVLSLARCITLFLFMIIIIIIIMSRKMQKLFEMSNEALSMVPISNQPEPSIRQEAESSIEYMSNQQTERMQRQIYQQRRREIQAYQAQIQAARLQQAQRRRLQQEQRQRIQRQRQQYQYQLSQQQQQYLRQKQDQRLRLLAEKEQRRQLWEFNLKKQKQLAEKQQRQAAEKKRLQQQKVKKLKQFGNDKLKSNGDGGDSPPQSQQQNIQKLQYVKGQFSLFAHRSQTQNIKLRRYIKRIINQAIQSHLVELEKVIKVQKQLQKASKELIDKYKNHFKLPQQMIKFMRDPISTELQQIEISNPNIPKMTLQTRIQNFLYKVIQMRQYAIVQGKIVEKRNFKMNQYLQDQAKNIYVPSKLHQNYYLKINHSNQMMQYAILSQNKLMSRQQFGNMNKQQRQTIVAMIYKFLQEKKIIVPKGEIIQHIESKIQEIKRNH